MSSPDPTAALLTSRRENIFERLTSILDFFKAQTSSSKAKKIKARYSVVNDIYQEYNKLEVQILEYNSIAPATGKLAYKKERIAIDDVLFEIHELYESLMESARGGTMQVATNRLPKVKLPKFYGDFWQWNSFKAAFESMVDTAPIGNIEKFQRLRECVEGEPLRLIEHFTLSADNYALAYKTLITRYDNPRIAANTYLHSLLNYKTPNSDSRAALQEYLSHHYDSVKSFKALSIPNHYDYLLFQICYVHLDKKTQRAFDAKFSAETFPSYDDLIEFVQNQIRIMELHAVETEKSSRGSVRHAFNISKPTSERDPNKLSTSCYACSSSHALIYCDKFLNMSVCERYELLKSHHLCFNCFRKHQRSMCNSHKRCKRCGRAHHTLLHSEVEEKNKEVSKACVNNTAVGNKSVSNEVATPRVTCVGTQSFTTSNCILLGTAQGYIAEPGRKSVTPIRILLDPGSQVSCITQEAINKVKIKIEPEATQIKGVSDMTVSSQGRANCLIYTNPKCTRGFNFSLVVLPVISGSLPKVNIEDSVRQRFSKYKLADPNFDQGGPIDVLIGADYYFNVISNKSILRGKPNGVHTAFGMVLMGEVAAPLGMSTRQSYLITYDALDHTLNKFWESENPDAVSPPEDNWCEEFFKKTLRRNVSGRYIVALPFNCEQPNLKIGNNRKYALRRLFSMERRFKVNENLRKEYAKFMQEYQDLGHMTVAENSSNYVIPHHAVHKESTTTKLRVVFDASQEGDNGNALNQLLRKGPKLQSDIFLTITGFRKFKVALVADIRMMYRQILVREEDRHFQRIFWRESPEEPPKEFELNTVTYGLTCSSFLAQRVIRQLVADEGKDFPLASSALLNQIYVDDIVVGGSSDADALQLYRELVELLGRGGFFPRKWSSSSSEVLNQIPTEHKETPLNIEGEEGTIFKVLGLKWDPKLDAFTYYIDPFKEEPTKRTVLSYIARMFDPLGWLTPFTFLCKYFMQILWLEGITWDDSLPVRLRQQWDKLVSEVQCLAQVRIPRFVPALTASKMQVLGFCDASEKGYAAVLYVRCVVDNTVMVSLLGGRSKVAPVKPMSIPRLELNAAYLLAKLFDAYKPVVGKLPCLSPILFSDSQVVLGWLRTPAHKLKTYVGNRVVEILDKTAPQFWLHVRSGNNAADCASRGLEPRELANHSLWWNGPEFLRQPNWEPEIIATEAIELPELKAECRVLVATAEEGSKQLLKTLEKYSTLTKIIRVLAYMLRMLKKSPTGPLKLQEIRYALEKAIYLTQNFYFSKEKSLMRRGLPVPTLQSLTPFLDQRDLVRVGGRLENAPIPYDARHPVLIPYASHLARLIVKFYHRITLHGGPQVTRTVIQRRYWIPKVGNLIKSVIFNCVTCRRQKFKPIIPMMGELPPSRFDQVRPFLRTGTDFAGPFNLRETPRKKTYSFKAYVCLFICFSTRAVHMEIVTSLTTDSFLAALDRFIARRGLCAFLYSDNGTNFTGAARKLSEVADFLGQNSKTLEQECTTRQIQWFFNPPAAPHFGGLWEAAVKSFKFHLNRVMSSHAFTLEEFGTLTCRIEAILNSRPLFPLSSTPSDAAMLLTPGHFLIGAPLLAVPEVPLTDLKMNTLSRWQLIAQCVQHFWKAWSRAYLQSLLPRKKWQDNQGSLKVGDIVIIKNEKTNPLSWPLGKVEELTEGKDGICRVAKVRCNNNQLVRPVHVLSKLVGDEISQAN